MIPKVVVELADLIEPGWSELGEFSAIRAHVLKIAWRIYDDGYRKPYKGPSQSEPQ